MLKFSHRHGGGGCDLNFTSGTGWQDEIEALQAQCSGIVQVPDDYTTYVNSLVDDLLRDGDDEAGEDNNLPWDDQED